MLRCVWYVVWSTCEQHLELLALLDEVVHCFHCLCDVLLSKWDGHVQRWLSRLFC